MYYLFNFHFDVDFNLAAVFAIVFVRAQLSSKQANDCRSEWVSKCALTFIFMLLAFIFVLLNTKWNIRYRSLAVFFRVFFRSSFVRLLRMVHAMFLYSLRCFRSPIKITLDSFRYGCHCLSVFFSLSLPPHVHHGFVPSKFLVDWNNVQKKEETWKNITERRTTTKKGIFFCRCRFPFVLNIDSFLFVVVLSFMCKYCVFYANKRTDMKQSVCTSGCLWGKQSRQKWGKIMCFQKFYWFCVMNTNMYIK